MGAGAKVEKVCHLHSTPVSGRVAFAGSAFNITVDERIRVTYSCG
jgi:hypothetical protein